MTSSFLDVEDSKKKFAASIPLLDLIVFLPVDNYGTPPDGTDEKASSLARYVGWG
jgi:hypothetical protein